MKKRYIIMSLVFVGLLYISLFGGSDYTNPGKAAETDIFDNENIYSLTAIHEILANQVQEKFAVESEIAVAENPEQSNNLKVDSTAPKPKDGVSDNVSNSAGKNSDKAVTTQKKDKYLTSAVPAGKPLPVEPENVTVNGDVKLTCTLSVTCKTILDNKDDFDESKLELLPEDGVIYPAQQVTFYEGESVFNVLQREMKNNGIHMEFEATPIYNSNYIEGINNIYEFDCGELSGWMYKVNGWFPNYGCSRYLLKEGDVVNWVYTCDLGRDVGGYVNTEDAK